MIYSQSKLNYFNFVRTNNTKFSKLKHMKKLFTLMTFALISLWSAAQTDTLLIENFDNDPTSNPNWGQAVYPPGIANDTMWYNWDADGLADQSGAGRPGEWYWVANG